MECTCSEYENKEIIFSESNIYKNEIVTLSYKNGNRRSYYSIKESKTINLTDEYDQRICITVKDGIFNKKGIIIYLFVLTLFLPIIMVSGAIPMPNYKKYIFFAKNNTTIISFDASDKISINYLNKNIKYKTKNYSILFIFLFFLWIMIGVSIIIFFAGRN